MIDHQRLATLIVEALCDPKNKPVTWTEWDWIGGEMIYKREDATQHKIRIVHELLRKWDGDSMMLK